MNKQDENDEEWGDEVVTFRDMIRDNMGRLLSNACGYVWWDWMGRGQGGKHDTQMYPIVIRTTDLITTIMKTVI